MKPILTDNACRLTCIEPDYTQLIPAMQLRRMSRILRMSIYAGMDCIQKAENPLLDGIITATGKGSLIDTEKFVKDLEHYQEEMLNPTPFILSTYNAVNGAIALQKNTTGYNQTYVHRGSSFELAMYDAQLKLSEHTNKMNFLVGSFDEITDEYFIIKSNVNKWKTNRDASLPLWSQANSSGTIAGEGATFFMLSNHAVADAIKLHRVNSFNQELAKDLSQQLHLILQKTDTSIDEIQLLVLGYNGDVNHNDAYDKIVALFPKGTPIMVFKNLCGEYETAGAYAFWQLKQYLNGKSLPNEVWYNKAPFALPKKVLYYNHYQNRNHNIAILG